MSLKALTWAFEQDLKPDLKIVLLALADYANDDGTSFPGQRSIGIKTSMSERTVRTKLAELEELGYIARRRRTNGDGYRTTDEYKLLPAGSAAGPTGNGAEPLRQAVAATEEPSEPSVKKKRAHRLPEDWMPSNAHRVQAAGKLIDVDLEAEKFRDWTLANDVLKTDWEATFRNWIRNARPETRQRAGSTRTTPTDRMQEIMAIRDPREMGMIE